VTSTNLQFLLAFTLGAGAGTMVFFHASKNAIKHPSAWASLVFVALMVGLPTYLLHVRRTRRRGPGAAS
jgi:hypothetical protein